MRTCRHTPCRAGRGRPLRALVSNYGQDVRVGLVQAGDWGQ